MRGDVGSNPAQGEFSFEHLFSLKNMIIWGVQGQGFSHFFSPETISKGDDIKIKRIVSLFFLPLPLYLAFTAVLSLFLARLHGLKAA